jgi:hypothetical protein
MASGKDRLVTGSPGRDSDVFNRLVDCLTPPYLILYLLHTSRGEGEEGRYQSREFTRAELQWFLNRFSSFLAGDARHDIWVHSPSDGGTLIWDRHNLIHGYGPVDRFSSALLALRFSQGTIEVPAPHQHHYRPEFDADAARVLSEYQWTRTALHPEDEQ